MVHEYCISWFGYVGCLSHSAIQQEPGQQEYRITDETRKKMLRLWSIVQTHISYEQDTFYNLLDQAVQDAYQLDEVIRSRPVQSEQQQTASLKDATGKVPGGKQE